MNEESLENVQTDVPSYEDIMRQMRINFNRAGISIDDPNKSNKLLFLTLYLLLGLATIEEAGFLRSKMSFENIVELTRLAPCTTISILSLLKVFWYSCKRDKICELSRCIQMHYYDMMEKKGEMAVVKPDIAFLITLTKYHYIINLALIFFYNFLTLVTAIVNYLLTKEWHVELPYAIVLPFSMESPFVYTAAYVQLITGGFVCMIYFTMTDEIYFTLTSLVCMFFKVLSNKVENLDSRESDKSLNEIIEKHQYAIKLSEDLEELFTGPILFDVATASIILCSLGFILSLGDVSHLPTATLFFFSVLLRILMLSLFGEDLIFQSSRVAESAYFCKWYEMDLKSKQKLIIIRERALKPQCLTAYKFSVVAFTTFSKILGTSWSYFTILKTVYKPAEQLKV